MGLCSGLYALSLLVLLLCFAGECRGQCGNTAASSGRLFSCQLVGQDCFLDALPPGTEVDFSVSLLGYPGRPDWLNLLQSEVAVAHLYGTPAPEEGDAGLSVYEVLALRKDTFNTSSKSFLLSVDNLDQEQTKLIIELYLSDMLMSDFLSPAVLQRFSDTLKDVFFSSSAVVAVIDPVSRGFSIPPPPEKIGVIVQATPGLNVTRFDVVTNETARLAQGFSCEGAAPNPPVSYELFMSRNFSVDWCEFKVDTVLAQSPSTEGEVAEEEEHVELPSLSRASSVPIIAICIVCFVVLVSMVITLVVVFFCRRKQGAYIVKGGKRRHRKAIMSHEARRASSPPTHAQRLLRDLAQLPRRRPSPLEGAHGGEVVRPTSGDGQSILEFQEVTDSSSRTSSTHDTATVEPPPYSYPERLLSHPLPPSNQI